jgi:hypothetical protein
VYREQKTLARGVGVGKNDSEYSDIDRGLRSILTSQHDHTNGAHHPPHAPNHLPTELDKTYLGLTVTQRAAHTLDKPN